MTVQIIAIVDKSGSMWSKVADTIGGFNTFADEQLKLGEDAELSLVQFDDQYEMTHYRKPLKDVPKLSEETYVPRGGTALLDAIGKTIVQFEHIQKTFPDNVKGVIIAIITDGGENASREYNKDQIREMTTRMEKEHNWKFVYMGANQDSFSVAKTMGINTAMNFADTGEGVRSAYSCMSASTSMYRSSVGNVKADSKLEDLVDVIKGSNP